MFAQDLLNLTIVDEDYAEEVSDYRWSMPSNTCWYADTIVRVKRKYDLSVSESEMRALDNILNRCGQSIGSEVGPALIP